ncbi:MAG: glycerophosphodiester phosphodiesterase [Promethearchaeota archaeon]
MGFLKIIEHKEEKILIIAHRGASNIAPENTLKAFKIAIELKADYIELDVQESKDGFLVVAHDEDLNRITGVDGLIKDLTLGELKALNFGEGEKIPTLQEVIELIKGKIALNCEIKVKNISNKVIALFNKYQIADQVVVSSFLHDELLKIQKVDPKIKLASLEPRQYGKKFNWDVKKEMIQFCIDYKLFAINPIYFLIDQQFVEFAHRNDIKIFPWTVDSEPSIRKLIKYGVDGIITNDVRATKSIIKQEKY